MTTARPARPANRPTARPERRQNNSLDLLSGTDQGLVRPSCPLCNSAVYRIPRRFTDRLLSLFKPVLRYSCRDPLCGWEGRLRTHRTSHDKHTSRFVDGNRRYLIEPSLEMPTPGSLTDG